MPIEHVVKQGEYLSQIAAHYGFADIMPIWDNPANAQLKKKRGNPNVLYPGDKLVIPDKETKEETGVTGQRHRFQVHGCMPVLRLAIKDVDNQPIANTPCKLIIDLDAYDLMTDGEGKIEQRIPLKASHGELFIQNVNIPLIIGQLDPVEEQTGWQARLNNLGYNAGPPDEADEQQVRSAVEEFQCDNGLEVDGVCGPETQKKLKEVHGC